MPVRAEARKRFKNLTFTGNILTHIIRSLTMRHALYIRNNALMHLSTPSTTLRTFAYAMSTLALFAFAGCCCTRHPKPAPTQYTWPPSSNLSIHNTQSPTALLISGGGNGAAWGSGFLESWSKRNDAQTMPKFDLVTGVSAGALLATSAFLGTPDTVTSLWPKVSNSDVYRSYGLLQAWFCCKRGIYSTSPLAASLQKWLPNDVIDAVAQAATDTQRKLLVSTYDLDADSRVIWDMTKIAVAKQYDLYRSVIRASAAALPFFEAVDINGHLHADGAIVANVFYADVLTACRKITPNKPRVYILALQNTRASLGRAASFKDGLIGVNKRAINKLVESSATLALWAAMTQSKEIDASYALPSNIYAISHLDFTYDKATKDLLSTGRIDGAKLNWQKTPYAPSLNGGE